MNLEDGFGYSDSRVEAEQQTHGLRGEVVSGKKLLPVRPQKLVRHGRHLLAQLRVGAQNHHLRAGPPPRPARAPRPQFRELAGN